MRVLGGFFCVCFGEWIVFCTITLFGILVLLGILSARYAKPTTIHWQRAKDVWRNLRNQKELEMESKVMMNK